MKEIAIVSGDTRTLDKVTHILQTNADIILVDEPDGTDCEPLYLRMPPPIEEPILVEDERPYWKRQKRGKGNKFRR